MDLLKSKSKRLFQTLFLCYLSIAASAQINGDYQFTNSLGDGNWNNAANWQVYNSGWEAAITYPGEVSGAGNIYINDGNHILLTLDVPEEIGGIIFVDGTTTITDITLGSFHLAVSGDITFGNPNGNVDAYEQAIFINSGTLSCGSVTMVDTDDNTEDTRIDIETGTLIVNGDITMANGNRNSIYFANSACTGEVYIYGDFNGNGFTRGGSTVYYSDAAEQIVGNCYYNNLVLTGGNKTLRNSTNIYGTLTLGTVLDIVNRQLYFSNSALLQPESSFGVSAMINISNNGYIRRDGNEASDYEMVFPVGIGSDYSPMEITSVTGSDVNGQFYLRLYAEKHQLTVGTNNVLTRYWDISTIGLALTSTTGTFTYSDNDVLSPIIESNLTTVGRFDGSAWQENETTTGYNHSTNQISFTNVSQIEGEWTLGEAAGCFDGLPSGKYTIADGNWTATTTWNDGVVPLNDGTENITVFHSLGNLNSDINANALTIKKDGYINYYNRNITIQSDLTIDGQVVDNNSTGNISIGNNLTINNGGSYNIQRGLLSVTGVTKIEDGGTLSDTDGNGSSTFNGLVTIEPGGTFTSNVDDFTFNAGLENNGTFINSSSYNLLSDLTITGSSELQFTNDIYIADNITLTNENSGGITITDILDGLGNNATLINKGIVNYYRTYRVPMLTGVLDCGSYENTFNYYRDGRQYIKATTYYNLICSNNDDKELQGTTTVLNNLSTSETADFECLGNDLIISGSVNHGSTGVFTTGSNTVTYNGTSNQNILAIDYGGNLVLEGAGNKTLQNSTTVTGDVTIKGTAILDLNSQQFTTNGNITISNGASLEVNENATLQLADGITLDNNGIFKVVGTSGNPATVTTSGSGGYLINQSDAAAEFHALYGVFDYTGGVTITNGTVDATNNFSYTSFTNGTGTEYLNISGLEPTGGLTSVQSAVFESGPTYNVSRTTGTETVSFVQATGDLSGENFDNDNANPGSLIEWLDPTAIYYSTGDVSAYATSSWAHNEDGTGGNPSLADLTAGTLTLIVQDGHTVTLDSNGNIDVNKLIIGEGTSGVFQIGGDATQQTLTIQELLDVKTGGSLIPSSEGAPAHIIKLYGNLINNGTINLYQSFTQVANLEIYGNMVFSGSNTPSLNKLTFKNGCEATANTNLDINNNLILESGAVFNDGGNTHTIEYNWTNNGGTYNATGSLIFDGVTASITASGTSTTFNNVSFNSSGLNTIKEDIIVNGDFVVGNNTQVSVDNITVTFNGNYTIETGSIYAQANNYTYFNGTSAQSITLDGTTSFDEISFANGGTNTKTINGNINANGRLTINNGATVEGNGDHKISGGLRVDGTCNFSGSITMYGGYLEASDASVSAFTLGTSELIIDGPVNMRHIDGGSTITVTVQNNISIIGGYLVINDDAILVGQPTYSLSLDDGLSLYIRGADNFPNGFGSYNFAPTAWVIYDANMDQMVRGGFSYGRLRTSYATKTVDGAIEITGYLDLNNNVTLDLQNYSHIFSGTTIENGSQNGSIDGSNATLTVDGVDFDQTIQSSGTGSYVFNNLNLIQNSATVTKTITFQSGCDITVNNDLTIENTGGTNAIQLIINLNDNNISGTANNFTLGAHCRLYTDNVNFGSGVIDHFIGTKSLDITSTVYYSLDGAQNIADDITYGNITFNGGDKTAEGALDINGDISRTNGTPVLYDGGFTHTLAGDWLLNNSAYYTQTSASGTITFDGVDQDIDGYTFNNITIANSGTANLFRDLIIYGNLTVEDGSSFEASALDMAIGGNILINGSGVYAQSTGITTLNGVINQSVTLSPTSTIGSLIINKTNPAGETATILSEMHIQNSLTVSRDAGILDISNQDVYIGNDFTIYDYTGVTNFISTGSTVTFNGSTAQYVRSYHENNLIFGNLIFTGSGDKTFDYNDPTPDLASQSFEVNGNFTINGSVVEGNNINLYVRGNWNNNGTFNHGRTVYFDRNNQSISSSSFYDVNFQGSDHKTLTGNITVTRDLYIDGTATLEANGNDITVGRHWYNDVVDASFDHGNGKVVFNGAYGSDAYTGTTNGSQTGKTFYDVEVNKASNELDLLGDLVVENNLTISSNSLRTGAYDVYVAGDFDNQGTYNCNNDASLLTLNATGGSRIFNPNGATIRGISINASGATYEMLSDFTLDNGNMSITAGTLDINKNTLQLNDYGRKIDIDGGTLIVDSASVIQFTNLQSINLNSGVLYLVGKEGMTANLKNSDTNDAFTINAIGGTLYAQYYTIQKGTIILSGSSLDATDNLSNGTFTEGDGGTSYIDLSAYDLGGDITLNGMIFNTGATYNISRTSGNGTVTVQDASGGLAGEIFELDDGTPGTLINWTFPAGFYWDGNGSAANTDWTDALNWDGNTVPGINDIVYLDHSKLSDAYDVVLSGTDGDCERLNIDIQGGNAISMNIGSASQLNVREHVNIGTGATLVQTDATSILNIGKNWTNLGTYTPNTGKVIFNGTSGEYIISTGGTGPGKAFYDVQFDAGTSIYTVDNLVDIDNDLTITSGTLDLSSPNNDLTVGGDWYLDQINGGAFIPNNADLTLDGSIQSLTNGSFYNLIIGSSSTTTLNSNIAVENTLTMNNGSSFNALENNIYVGNDWQNDGGTFSQSGFGTVIFNGTTNQSIDQGTGSTIFNNITFSNTGAKYLEQDITVNGDVLISDASGLLNARTYLITGAGTDNTFINNEDFQIEGESNFPAEFENLSFSTSSETRYWSDLDQEVEAITYGSLSFRSLTDGVTSTKTALGDLTITNDIYFTSTTRFAILDLATNDVNITLSDNIDMRGSSSMNWGTGNSTLYHIGANWYIDADISGFNNLVLEGSGDKYAQGNLSISGDVTVKSGIDFMMYNSSNRNNFSTITGTPSHTIYLETGSRIFNSRPSTDGVAIPEGFGTYDFNENSSYFLYSTGIDQTIYTGSNIAYGNLIFDSEKNVTADGTDILDINGDWDIRDATFYDGGNDIEVAGANIYVTNYVSSSNDRTLTLNGLRDQYIRDDINNSMTFANIVFDGTGTKTICDYNDVAFINGNLTINPGITVTTAEVITFNGANWTNNGIYTQTGQKLILNGASDQTIDPGASDESNYFYSLEFSGASTKTFINNGADINNDFIINEGTVELGNLDYTIYDEIVNTSGGVLNSANANITLDGAAQTVDSPDFEVNNLISSGSNYKYLASDWTINGDLYIETGTTLQTTTNNYNIDLAGNWTNKGSFIDNQSKVTFNGSSNPISIETNGDNFFDIDFTPSAAVTYNLVSTNNRFADVMYIGANAELDLNGQTLYLGRDNTTTVNHTIDGALTIDGGAFLYVNNDNNQTTLDVNGALNIVGSSTTDVATLTSENTNNVNKTQINIQPGATMGARYYVIEYVADEGINLMSGSTLDATNNFSDGTFLNMRDQLGARYLVLESDYSGGNIANVSFNYNGTPVQGRHFNVERKLASTPITFENITGALGSYKYEDDDQAVAFDNGLCRWPEITETYWTGNIDSDWHKDGNWDNGIPTSLIDAIIPDRDNDPIIFSDNAVCKSLNITDGTLRLESSKNITASEDISIITGLLYVNSSASNIYVGGDWTVDTYGNFSHGNATVTFNSGSGYVQIIPGSSSFNNLVFNNASTTFEISDDELDIDGALTILNGTLRPTTNNYSYNLYGDYMITNGHFDTSGATNGTFTLLANGDQLITSGVFDNLEVAGTGNKNFAGEITIEGSTNIYSSLVSQTSSTIHFNGDVDIKASGTFNDGSETHYFSGTNWHGDGTYTGSGTVTFNRTTGYQYLYNAVFNNLIINCTGQRLYLEGDVSINGDMTFEEGVSRVNLQTSTFTGNGTGTFTVDDGIDVYVYGSNNFPKSFATYTLSSTSNTRYYSSSNQNIDGVSYGNLFMDNENTKTLTGDTEVKGNLYFYESTIDVSSNNYSLTIGGYWYNNSSTGGHFICRNGDVIFTNSSNASINIGGSNTNDFYNLTVNGSARVSAVNNLSNDFIVQNNLTVTNGAFSANGRTIYVGGDLLATGGGSFSENTGTYYLNKASGSANIGSNGSSLLNITINSGATYTVQNNLTANGNFALLSGVFDGNGKTVNLGTYNNIVTIDGTYKVGAGGILGLGNSTSLTVSNTGRIEVVGSESGIARISNNDSGGRYGFIVEGEIAAEYYFFEYMSNVGIYLTNTATIDAIHHFSNGTFSNGATTGQLLRIENTQDFSGANRLENVLFPNNPGGAASNVAKYSAVSGNLEIYNSSGLFAGENYDNDPNDLIDWSGPIVLTWNGSEGTNWNNAANWTASYGESFVPTDTNTVIIASTVNQPILTIAGQHTGNLTIESGAEIRISTSPGDTEVDLNVDGDLTIEGTLRTMSAEDLITVEGNWTANNSGVVMLKGNVTFDGIGAALLVDNNSYDFYSLTISGTSQYQITENTTVKNDFIINSGSYFDVSPSDYTLTVNGNFINNGTFNAQQGTVLLTANSSTRSLSGGNSEFNNLQVNAPSTLYNMTSDLIVNGNLEILNGTLDVQTNTLHVGNGDATENISISGVLLVNAGATLDMGDGAALNVNSGGYIELLGSDASNRATLTSSSAGRYSFDVNSGGSIKASYYTVDYTDADGLYMHPGADIDDTYDLSNGIFSNGYPGTGSYMTLLHEMGVARDTLRNLVFNAGPAYSVTRTSGTTVFFFEDASGDIGNYLYEKDDEVTPSPSSGLLRWPFVNLYTWEGDIDNNWLTAGNWFDDQLPVLTSEVTIPVTGNNPIIDNSELIEIYALTIESSASLTIQEGARVTINDALVTNDGLIINNSVNNPASIIIDGNISGNTTVNWNGLEKAYWWHIGHSVTGVTQSNYDNSIGANRYALNRYTTQWERVAGLSNTFGDNFAFSDPLEGYSLILADENEVLSYDGILNNGDAYSKTNLTAQWHHFANPYPSYIDVRNLGFDMDNFMQTVYIDGHDNLVVSYNIATGIGTNGGSRYIAPGQAIWIRNYSISDFSIHKNTRIHQPSISLKSANSNPNALRLTLENSTVADETVIVFGNNGTETFSNNDSEKKMNGGDTPNLFTMKDNKEVVINYLPTFSNPVIIPLGFKISELKDENLTIVASNINDFDSEISVYLEDLVTGTVVNLRETNNYSFTPDQTLYQDRFNILFDYASVDDPTTGTDKQGVDPIKIIGVDQKVIVKVSDHLLKEAHKTIEVYNISGDLIKSLEISSTTTEFQLPKMHELYFVKVSAGQEFSVKKIIGTIKHGAN